MKKRRIWILLLCLGLLLTLAACGEESPSAVTPETEPVGASPETEPEEEAPEADPEEEAPETAEPEAESDGETDHAGEYLTFSTVDLEGNPWTEAELAGQELVMINFWEYWCGPCVKEMPDLEELYQNYKDQGFLILGVYSDDSDMEAVESTLETAGTTYPILAYCADFDPYQTGYVPTTIFLDSQGQLVGETVVGSKSYEEWAAIVEGLL